MRILIASFTVLWAAALPAEDKPPSADVNERILEELRQLREQVASLEKRIAELDERLRKSGESWGSAAFREGRGADRESLARIKLPADPTREQVLEYVRAIVRAIVRASRGQSSYSSDDPQIPMLVRIGRKNADVLVEAYDDSAQFYLCNALRRLAGEEHMDLILKELVVHPHLVEVVVEKGWTANAKKILTDALEGRPHYLPTGWIDAVASFRDPKTYDDLEAYFMEGMNRASTHDAICSLPGIDLEGAVVEAWEKPRGELPFAHQRNELAPIAVSYGIDEALYIAFDLLGREKWLSDRARNAILSHTNASGSDEELKAWYEQNVGRLRWHKESRKFLVQEP